jgi:hypothetical protein
LGFLAPGLQLLALARSSTEHMQRALQGRPLTVG